MRLLTLEGEATRPTLERTKEGMFSAVQFLVPGAQVLDLYAGSGQLGLEALSRGAAFCTFVDSSAAAVRVIHENIRHCSFAENSRVARMPAEEFLRRGGGPFDLVFIDPPYAGGEAAGVLALLPALCAEHAVVLLETSQQEELPQQAGELKLAKTYRYGNVKVSRYVFRP